MLALYNLSACIIIIIAMCGLLTEILKARYYIFLFLLTFGGTYVAYFLDVGQKITLFIITLTLLTISIGTKENKILNICLSCLGYIFNVIFNEIVLYFITKFLKFNVNDFTQVVIFSWSYVILLFIAIFYIRQLLYNKIKITRFFNSNHKNNLGLLINLLCFVVILIVNITLGETVGYNTDVLKMNCVLFVLCFASSSIVLLYFTRAIRSEEEKKADQARLKITENYVSGLEQLIDESRELRHDYKNLIATISGFIEEGDMDHLKEYFDQNIRNTWVDLDKKGKAWQSVKDVQPPELKGLLYEKVLKAVAADVNIRVIPDYELNIQYKAMKDLCRILGILIDNSIEAAEETDEKSVDIRIAKMEHGYQIIIQNTYFTKPDLAHLYQKGYSTKGADRGLGMYYAHEMILEHEEIEFEFEIQEHVIIQKIYIEL